MRDDTSIILTAYRETREGVTRNSKGKRVLRDIFDDGLGHLFDGLEKDALSGVVKKIKSDNRYQKRKVSDWEYKDFLSYFSRLLSNYGVSYERSGPRVDLLSMGRIYDRMVEIIGYSMSNQILKEYLEWWTSMYADRYHDSALKVSYLFNDNYIQKYVKRIDFGESSDRTETSEESTEVSDDDLYSLGGLSTLLMEKGIVVAWGYLKSKHSNSRQKEISDVLQTFNREVLERTMQITIDNAPYDSSLKIDFVELAFPFLEKHNLEAYKKISCATHFKTT